MHRDIKPANLLLDLRGAVWVTDFGLAKLDDDRGLTQTGDILGTLRYMAPETFKGQCDKRSELYSLGLTLYEMLAFRPAFDQTNRNTLVDQVMNAVVEPLGKLNPEIPADLQTIVHKAIEREPEHRYHSGQELADDLQRFLDDEPIKARRISLVERLTRWSRHNRGLAASLFAMILLVTALAVGSTIAAGHFRLLSGQLQTTVTDLTNAQTDLQRAREEAEGRANQNAKLAQENAQLAAARDTVAQAALAARKREAELRGLAEDREKSVQATLYAAEMNLAGQAAGEPSGVRRVLELTAHWRPEQNEDLRGWEWYYLQSLCHQDRLTLDHQWATCVDWSPDGQRLASAGKDGRVQIHEAVNGSHLNTLEAPSGYFSSIAYSPDGSKVAAGGHDKLVRIWDATTGDLLATLKGHRFYVTSVARRRDGARLASAASDREAEFIIWDAETFKQIKTVEIPVGESLIAWTPDDKQIAVAGDFYDAATGRKTSTPAFRRRKFALSPDGKWIAVAVNHGAEIRSAETNALRSTMTGHSHALITAVAWSPNGEFVATAGYDDTVKVWNVESAQEVATLRGHTNWVLDVKWSPDSAQLASVGNSAVKIWDLAKFQSRFAPEARLRGIRTLAWSGDGTALAMGGGGGVQIVDAESGRVISRLDAERAGYWSHWSPTLAWSRASQTIAVQRASQILLLHDRALQQRLVLDLPTKEGRSLAISPDGSRLATSYWVEANGDDNAVVVVYDVATGKEVSTVNLHRDAAGSLGWSADGTRLVSAGWQRGVVVRPETGEVVCQYSQDGIEWITSVAWSPRGDRVALACQDRTIRVLDAASGELRHVLNGHTGGVVYVSWNQDGSRIASGGTDHTVRIWSPDTGAMLLTLTGHRDHVQAVTWSPNGLRLASASADGDVRLWDAYAGYRRDESPKVLEAIDRRLATNPDDLDDLSLRMNLLEKLGDHAAAQRDRERCLEILERQRIEKPNDPVIRQHLVDFLTPADDPIEWAPLTPVKAASAGGAKLMVLDDGSILASGNDIAGDTYSIDVQCSLKRITAIKLEALPDASLPNSGPGRHASGNFQLSALRLFGRVSADGQALERLPFSNVSASFSYDASDADVQGIIDDESTKVWHIWGQTGRKQHVTLRLASPFTPSAESPLRIELKHRSLGEIVNLGRFRLLATSDLLWKDQLRSQVRRRAIGGNLLLGAAYLFAGDTDRAKALLEYPIESERESDSGVRLALLARLYQELGQPQEARKSCDELIGWLRTGKLPMEFRPLMFDVLTSVGGLSAKESKALLGRAEFASKLAKLNLEIEAAPDSAAKHFARGRMRAQLGRWSESAADLQRVVELGPDQRIPWMHAAALLLLSGDEQAYQRHCRALVKQFQGTSNPEVADVVCKTCLLLPAEIELSDLPAQVVRDAATDMQWEKAHNWFRAMFALIAYREGDYPGAVDWAEKVRGAVGQNKALALVVRAMAESRLGKTEPARQTLAAAEAVIPGELRTLGTDAYNGPLPVPAVVVSHDWLIPEILRREAAALIREADQVKDSTEQP